MPSNSPFLEQFKSESVRWLFIAMIALISAGGLAIAKDKFYTKAEVDAKDAAIEEAMDDACKTMQSEAEVQRSHIIELQKIQNENIVDKLEEIGEDIGRLEERSR